MPSRTHDDIDRQLHLVLGAVLSFFLLTSVYKKFSRNSDVEISAAKLGNQKVV